MAAKPPVEAIKPRQDATPAAPQSVATTPAPEAPKPAAVAAPEAVCGGRNPLSYFVCMEKECLRSAQLGTADCKKWRAGARRE